MPMHRRRVYIDRSLSGRRRSEEWFSYSIYLAAGILFLSLIGCLPELVSQTINWLTPHDLTNPAGLISPPEHVSMLTMLCEALTVISGAYLVLALFIISFATQRPR